MSQTTVVHDGPGSPCSPAAVLHRGAAASPGVSHRSPGTWRLCYTRCYTREQNVAAASEHAQACFRRQVAPTPSWCRVLRTPDRRLVTDSDGSAITRHARSAVL